MNNAQHYYPPLPSIDNTLHTLESGCSATLFNSPTHALLFAERIPYVASNRDKRIRRARRLADLKDALIRENHFEMDQEEITAGSSQMETTTLPFVQ